jgi:hypothetical protein
MGSFSLFSLYALFSPFTKNYHSMLSQHEDNAAWTAAAIASATQCMGIIESSSTATATRNATGQRDGTERTGKIIDAESASATPPGTRATGTQRGGTTDGRRDGSRRTGGLDAAAIVSVTPPATRNMTRNATRIADGQRDGTEHTGEVIGAEVTSAIPPGTRITGTQRDGTADGRRDGTRRTGGLDAATVASVTSLTRNADEQRDGTERTGEVIAAEVISAIPPGTRITGTQRDGTTDGRRNETRRTGGVDADATDNITPRMIP